MIKVSNGSCIRRLGARSMRAARARNAVAALAIALTTVLFTALFTIAATLNASIQQENFRQAGGDGHGAFKMLTLEQTEKLRAHPLIRESFARLFVGMPSDPPFHKTHVEVSYMEPAAAPHYFCVPAEGALPQEGTNQAATDTHVLSLLGVEPKIGTEFTLTFYLDKTADQLQPVTRTFTLSGWWEYDSAIIASHLLLPRSAAEEICAIGGESSDSMTGKWDLNVMFKNAMHIEENLLTILEDSGYQAENAMADDFIAIGVNWGYSGAQLSNSMDAMTLTAITAILLLITFTGYLIIYNVFQISVSNDIQFYGLLKTIGTTGRQIKRIIRRQAWLLCLTGIPTGLLLGFAAGNILTPVIIAQAVSKNLNMTVTFHPLIFIGAAAFSLITVFLSCARPGRMAARVSPTEAVRYTEGGNSAARKRLRSAEAGASLPRMAWANLGRNRSKTAVTVISLTLAVVLANITCTFAGSFDINKYLARNADVDFILADADYFQVNSASAGFGSPTQALPEEIIAEVAALDGVTENGRTYGEVTRIQQFVPESWFRQSESAWGPPEVVERRTEEAVRDRNGWLMNHTQVYGMEALPLSLLRVVEGDISALYDPSQNAIAAVMDVSDYNEVLENSHWAKVGDTVTLRYAAEWEYYFPDTGEIIEDFGAFYSSQDPRRWAERPKVYEDREYTVCALVVVPYTLCYRFFGADEYILNADVFKRDSGTESVMYWCFNTTDESAPAMEAFLADYTETVQPLYDYEGRATYVAKFEGFRRMFLTLGGALSIIIGLVGVLNFINAVLTGILARKRELAMLQSVGMTGKQMNTMLVYEGLYYTMLSAALSLVLSAALGPLVGSLCSAFWFFTYHFTVLPVLAVIPLFLILGILVPLLMYRSVNRRTIVERLREIES